MNNREFILLNNFYNFWDPDGTKDIHDFVSLAITSLVQTNQISRDTLVEFQKSKEVETQVDVLKTKIEELTRELRGLETEITESRSMLVNSTHTMSYGDPCSCSSYTVRSSC